MIQKLAENGHLSEAELTSFVSEAFRHEAIDGKRLLFIIPDSTRSMPMPEMFRALHAALHARVARMDYLIALGTHPPMPDTAIKKMMAERSEERRGKNAAVYV